MLFGAIASMAKTTGTRYILKRDLSFKWRDFGLALLVSGISYAAFRVRHGQVHGDSIIKR